MRNMHSKNTIFTLLAVTIKTFSPEYQHMAKIKLVTIVSKPEWASQFQY